MRTIKQFTIALLMVMLAVTSCKKDEQQSTDANSDAQMSSKTTKQLLAFRDQLKLKNGSSLPVDSATWYLEGLLNYEKANNNHYLDNKEYYYDSLTMNISGEEISISELNQAYAYFTSKLNQILGAKNDTLCKFDLIDMEINPIVQNQNQVTLQFSAALGFAPLGFSYTFEADDYWRWGWNLGKCDGTHIGQDAADKLEEKVMAASIQQPGYFIGVEMLTAYGCSSVFNDPNYPGSWHPSMIFSASGPGANPSEEPCLNPTELNYYLGKIPYIRELFKPQGKTFKNIDIVEDFFPSQDTWSRFHDYRLYYGNYIVIIPD